MAPRKVVVVGIDLCSDNIEQIEFTSNNTLLDWDVVVFAPHIENMISYSNSYQGKISLNEGMSFRLKEQCEHWRREIKHMLDAGRTVICYLPELQELFVDTGQRTHSGTGRNQKTTIMVAPYTNYECLPFSLKPRNSAGNSMKLSTKGSVLGPYWADFSELSAFKVTLHGSEPATPIFTRTGDLIVGGIFPTAAGGNFVALPMLDFWEDSFFDSDGEYTKEAETFANKLFSAWLSLDSALRSGTELTPAPPWSEDPKFALTAEVSLKAELLEAEARLTEAQKRKEETADALARAGALRALLYEKGKPLEQAIIRALEILGFEAQPYKDSVSEFDVVFQCGEGRLLGEAEGKDNKAVNVDKLRQLAMNLNEDLAREEVSAPAKPVLFGNGHRLTAPSERGPQFTDKCLNAALASNTALVETPALFDAVKYVSSSGDADYAALCRDVLLKSSGVVSFPPKPATVINTTEVAEA